MSGVRPDRNPFPPQATMSLDAMSAYRIDGIPTSQSRVPLERLKAIQVRYLADPAMGRAVAIHGQHGTGKTHTLLAALATARNELAGGKPPVVTYVRADGPDPLMLYRKLMSRWTATELAELAEHAFAGYAAEEFIASRDSVDGETDATRRLRNDPQLVDQAMNAGELSYTGVLNRQDDDIRRIQGRYGGFERVLRGLTSLASRPVAHRWLIAADVSADELKSLGVAGPIEQPHEVRIGIHVLAALARRAGRPLTLAIDQVEALLRTSDGMIDGANVGLLRGVVEDVVEEQGLILASVGEAVWQKLPVDLRQRFGPSEIHVPELSPVEAEDVLAAYMAPWSQNPEQTPIFPLTPDAVRQLLVESGGNMRRFIQACHLVYADCSPEVVEIDSERVIAALRTSGGVRTPDTGTVRSTVEKVLQHASGVVLADHVVDGQRIDYVVMEGRRIVLAVEISRAVFGQDEAVKAVEQIDKIHSLRRHNPVVVLVIVGYSSPDVRSLLQDVARVVIADNDEFAADLDAAVEESLPYSTGVLVDERLNGLREELLTLIERRTVEEHIVANRLDQADVQQQVIEWGKEVNRFRLKWLEERERLEQEIESQRSQLRGREIEEITSMQAEYIAARGARRIRERYIFRASVSLLAIFAIAVIPIVYSRYFSLILPISAIVVGFGASALMMAYRVYVRRETVQVTSRPLERMEDLKRLARQEPYSSLESKDPLRRYRAVLQNEHLEGSEAEIFRAALVEPSAIIRRALLTSVIVRYPDILMASLHEGLESSDLSGGVELVVDVWDYWSSLPADLRIVALMRRGASKDASLRDDEINVESWLESFLVSSAEESALVRAFEADDDTLLASALKEVSERNLRRAVAVLSPFDDDGLGAHHWLKCSDSIIDLYLFFRKALFYLAGGVEVPQSY